MKVGHWLIHHWLLWEPPILLIMAAHVDVTQVCLHAKVCFTVLAVFPTPHFNRT